MKKPNPRSSYLIKTAFLTCFLAASLLAGCSGGEGSNGGDNINNTDNSDQDGDGYSVADGDCDDTNPDIHPGAVEVCDDIDNDCANGVDDGVKNVYYFDNDRDGFGVDDPATNVEACNPPMGYVSVVGDCDDDNPFAFPNNPEVCDGIDNDCANGVDDGVDPDTYYQDKDGDGFGDDSVVQQGCVPPGDDWVLQGGDCDDDDPAVFPFNPEVCDGKDNDCDPSTPDPGLMTWYRDADGDGYGDPNDTLSVCSQPAGYVLVGGDCNDSNPAINPGAIELCDGIDNNCMNGVDEGPIATYTDADDDGFGDKNAAAVYLCEVKPGTADNNADCDDSNAGANPNAIEIPGNGIDENCDGTDSSAGTQCGHDSASAMSIPYLPPLQVLNSSDLTTGGPRGNGYYWDDFEIITYGGETFTVLYASMDAAAMRPCLYAYGPNSCTSWVGMSAGTSHGSPKGNHLSKVTVTNASAGYYYTPVTTYTAGQHGNYMYGVVPGSMGSSCGNDTYALWPLGWRRNLELTTSDTNSSGTPIPSAAFADDIEFYLEAGKTYTILMGNTSFLQRLYLARAGACATTIQSATAGITANGALIRYTPTQSDIYVAYASSIGSGLTGSYTFNVVEGSLGHECFDGPGANGEDGDTYVLYPLGRSGTGTLNFSDRIGDFGQRAFDDFETYLEKGDVISMTMTRTTGTFRPAIYLTRAGSCTTKVTQSYAPSSGNTTTLSYTATSSGIYTIVLTSYEENATGNYSFSSTLN